MMRHPRCTTWTLLALFALTLTGCGLYVNIPPQQGDVALHAADWIPVREIVADAVNHLADQRGLHDETYTFIVPEDDDGEVFDTIAPRLIGAPVRDSATDRPVVEVLKVRVRGSDAEVDLYAAPETAQLGDTVTVYLSWLPASNWSVDRTRLWRGGIEPDRPGRVRTSSPQDASPATDTGSEGDPESGEPTAEPAEPVKIEKLDV